MECIQNAPRNFTSGDVIITKGYRLHCQLVVHGSCIGWDVSSQRKRREQVIRKLISSTLDVAVKHRLTTVAFPAMGTGMLKVPRDKSAELMFSEVENFSRQNPNSTVKTVSFVLYDKDLELIKVFESHMKTLKAKRETITRLSAVKQTNISQTTKTKRNSSTSQKQSGSGDGPVKPISPLLSNVSIQIYSQTKDDIDNALLDIKTAFECPAASSEVTSGAKLTAPVVGVATAGEVQKIKELEMLYKVQIEINQQNGQQCIRFHGTTDGVQRTEKRIVTILEDIKTETESRTRANLNLPTDDLPQALSLEFQWYYFSKDDDKWLAYDKQINELIERSYLRRDVASQWQETDGTIYKVVFSTMEEQCASSGETPVQVKRLVKDMPTSWESMPDGVYYTEVDLNSSDAEYISVEKAVGSTYLKLTSRHVTKITRVQNVGLYQRYTAKKEAMSKICPPRTTLEQTLCHPTNPDFVSSVARTGFAAELKEQTGPGMKFSLKCDYSTGYNTRSSSSSSQQIVFQSKVLTGTFTFGGSYDTDLNSNID